MAKEVQEKTFVTEGSSEIARRRRRQGHQRQQHRVETATTATRGSLSLTLQRRRRWRHCHRFDAECDSKNKTRPSPLLLPPRSIQQQQQRSSNNGVNNNSLPPSAFLLRVPRDLVLPSALISPSWRSALPAQRVVAGRGRNGERERRKEGGSDVIRTESNLFSCAWPWCYLATPAINLCQ